MTDEQQQYDETLTKQQKRIAAAATIFLASVTAEKVVAEILQLVEAGQVNAALDIVDSHAPVIAAAISTSVADVGAGIMPEFAKKLPNPTIGIYFDPAHPHAAQTIRDGNMRLLREMSDQQRGAVQQAMARAYEQGLGTRAAARSFVDSIGLTQYQEQIVQNYRALLENGSKAALDRALRDRRFDGSVIRAVEGEPLDAAKIDRMVAAYRRGMLRNRSETIARTEGLRATSIGRHEAMLQAIEQAGISPDAVIRTWHATDDDRTRDWHITMQDQHRGINQPFIDGLGNALMYPGDSSAPAETVIACRCSSDWSLKH